MRSILHEWPHLDPRTGIAVFALWGALFGITLAGPGEAFEHSAIYGELRLYVEERPAGLVMLFSAAALFWSIRAHTPLTVRLLIGWACGTFWMVLGGMLLAGGWNSGTFSSAGMFSLLGGFGCVFSIRQWMAQA